MEKKPSVYTVLKYIRSVIRNRRIRDQAFDRHAYTLSRHLWPWRESRLVTLVFLVVSLDFASTYAVLKLSGNKYVFEGGPMASWALGIGGFPALFFADIVAASFLLLVAITSRLGYNRFGFKGFGRAAFTLTLIPYVVVTTAIIFNNVVLTFL